jgi:hypothetical protein
LVVQQSPPKSCCLDSPNSGDQSVQREQVVLSSSAIVQGLLKRHRALPQQERALKPLNGLEVPLSQSFEVGIFEQLTRFSSNRRTDGKSKVRWRRLG